MMSDAGKATNRARVTVYLPSALTRLFSESQASIKLHAATVDDMLDVLDERWPGMRDRLADSSPAIRRHINIFVDGRRARLDTALRAEVDVYVLTAMSGG